ncbi:AMP-binding protein [Parasphingorhabdus cellanae]|uniref:AMP-binding protein n=2 Tax=Parasphingorhabdus cellanae TaxID=2806553 RepID=A0ABX7T842_9SPHN|nr:AMP-binding protein [Parasphingorhabdus cellanae]
MRYAQLSAFAADEPDRFWVEVADKLAWTKRWDKVLGDGQGPIPRWFIGGELNACHNCVDRHVDDGFGDQVAIQYESAVTQISRSLTFAELKDATARLGGAMRARGVAKGDRIIIYMPNSPEAVIAMLACARIGAIHSVVFGGFAAKELAARIDDATPKLVIAASCGIEGAKVLPYQPMLEEAYAIADHRIEATIYWQREQAPADIGKTDAVDWADEIANAEPAPCEPVKATDPLYILYTSGTTGQPKGIVRDTGGYLAALAWTMEGIYNCPPGSTYWAASDVGWVVGHSYIVYGPLLNRNTTVVFEGKPVGTPDAGIFWSIMAKHKVRSFFTAPTAIRAIKQVDPEGALAAGHDLSSLKAVYLAGERTDPSTLEWTEKLLSKPVVDHWWQTETGWAICANPLGVEELPTKAGSTSVPMPGWDIACLDEDGVPVAANETGAIVARLPLPPGAAPTLWKAEERYVEAYLERYVGYYLSGDAGYIDEDGFVYVMTRTDDVINVAGHRLSSSAIEEVLAANPSVAECAVVGIHDDLKGQIPAGFVVLKAGEQSDSGLLQQQLVLDVRTAIGPVAAFKQVHIVSKLPKTRSGKILRRNIRQIADREEATIPATIEDRAVLEEYYKLFEYESGAV